jgi:trans-aconitate 2-methyltransferase
MNWNPEDYAKNSSAQLGWARELISRLALGGSETVLDVGCGDGKITAAFASTLPDGYVLGVDSSPEFIAYASLHYPPAQFQSLHFQQMDARSLSCGRQFDLIFSNATLHWVDDQRAFLLGASRHLRIGGRLIVSCGGVGNASEVVATLNDMQESSKWHRFFDGFAFPYYFHSPAEYSPWLVEAGLRPTHCELVERDMVHDGPEGLAGWIRTTWMPYTLRLPEEMRENFITELVSRYLHDSPPDSSGRTHVRMVRLEVEATKPR